jgi:hypothetical protein
MWYFNDSTKPDITQKSQTEKKPFERPPIRRFDTWDIMPKSKTGEAL